MNIESNPPSRTIRVASIALVTILAGCAASSHSGLRTGWIKQLLPGSAVALQVQASPATIPCAAGKTQEEIAQTVWAVVAVAHFRSVSYQTLPLDTHFVPAIGARVLTNALECRVLPEQ